MRHFFKILPVFIAVFSFAASAQAQPAERPDYARDTLWIETADGTRHDFDIELALEPSDQAFGLMYVREMPADQGMLFVFDEAAPRSFWTMNTFLSLDMVFIGADGRIVNIAEETRPFNAARGPDTHRSTAPAVAVLEILGGTADDLGIEAGDLVGHDLLGTGE
ncbi:MAG: DUF192 domain-containing protein [Azospirillaceae bacterium]